MRIIASTKRNLLNKIAEGGFREDLYYRLDVLRIVVPPLRERIEDVPSLAEHLLRRISGQEECRIGPEVVELLQRHQWPGQRSRSWPTRSNGPIWSAAGRITAELLQAEINHIVSNAVKPLPTGDFQAAMDQTERELLERALRTAGGNKTAAAAALGMKSSTFRDKLSKHGLG